MCYNDFRTILKQYNSTLCLMSHAVCFILFINKYSRFFVLVQVTMSRKGYQVFYFILLVMLFSIIKHIKFRERHIRHKVYALSTLTKKDVCKPHKNIVFIKTHKTGSTTVRKLLNEFITKNNFTKVSYY